ncbi:unnamed protein product [Amaranthus hypochondriacus]
MKTSGNVFSSGGGTNGSGNQENGDVKVGNSSTKYGSGSGSSWSGCGNHHYYAGQDMSVKHYHHHHHTMNGFATKPTRDVQPNDRDLVSKQIAKKSVDDYMSTRTINPSLHQFF